MRKCRHVGLWRARVVDVEVTQRAARGRLGEPSLRVLVGDASGARSEVLVPFLRRCAPVCSHFYGPCLRLDASSVRSEVPGPFLCALACLVVSCWCWRCVRMLAFLCVPGCGSTEKWAALRAFNWDQEMKLT